MVYVNGFYLVGSKINDLAFFFFLLCLIPFVTWVRGKPSCRVASKGTSKWPPLFTQCEIHYVFTVLLG